MTLRELAVQIPVWPNGHINNKVGSILWGWSSQPRHTLEDLEELNGLVARAKYLIAHPPGSTVPTPPAGGTPIAQVVRIAA